MTLISQVRSETIAEFAKAILHGDSEHRAWLTEAAQAFILGRPVPPARGKGNKEVLAEAVFANAAEAGKFYIALKLIGDRARSLQGGGIANSGAANVVEEIVEIVQGNTREAPNIGLIAWNIIRGNFDDHALDLATWIGGDFENLKLLLETIATAAQAYADEVANDAQRGSP